MVRALRRPCFSASFLNHNITVGRYLISPLPKQLACGAWTSSVSIRSGAGRSTHDRVLRLTRTFHDSPSATAYAVAEGRNYIGHRHPANHPA